MMSNIAMRVILKQTKIKEFTCFFFKKITRKNQTRVSSYLSGTKKKSKNCLGFFDIINIFKVCLEQRFFVFIFF